MKSDLASAQPATNGRALLSLADPAGEAIASALGLRFDGLQEWAAGASWAFTDVNAHSRTYQITFYMPPGAGLIEVARRLKEKGRAQVEPSVRSDVSEA